MLQQIPRSRTLKAVEKFFEFETIWTEPVLGKPHGGIQNRKEEGNHNTYGHWSSITTYTFLCR